MNSNQDLDLISTQEYEMLVRDLTDSGFTRKHAEKIALEQIKRVLR